MCIRFQFRFFLGRFSLLCFWVLLLSSCWQSDIVSIHSFKEVDFTQVPSGAWALFDVDETLVQPVDGYLVNEFKKDVIAFKKK